MYDSMRELSRELDKRGVTVNVGCTRKWWSVSVNGDLAVFGTESESEVRAFLTGLLVATVHSITVH